MTLIQRQTKITAALENIYRRKVQNPGIRSAAVRRLMVFNTKRMTFAGYTEQEAKDSFRQCCDVAELNVAFSLACQ
jgi:hypothetical protein